MTRLVDVLWLALFLAVCVLIVLGHRAWRQYRADVDHDLTQLETAYPISNLSERRPR